MPIPRAKVRGQALEDGRKTSIRSRKRRDESQE